MKDNGDFFSRSIQELPLSDEFKHMAEEHNFQTLHDMLEVEAADLIQRRGMNYHLVQEFVDYLEQNGQGHLLKE